MGVEQGDVLAPLLFAVAFRRPVERLREILVATLVADHGYSLEDAESEVVLGAYLDDVLVGLPAPLAAQVPAIAAQAFAPAGCEVEQHKTKVWVPAGLCPAGVSARWWSPDGLRVLGAPAEGETPLAALGELGSVIGHPTMIEAFLEQSLAGYRVFVGQVVGAAFEADTSWSRVQGGVGLLRLCALPRLLHLFRALPPAATLGFAEKADQATLDSYEKLLTAKLITQPQQTQAALPTRLGGSGLLRFRGLRAQAWLGSWLGTLPAVRALAGERLASAEVCTQGQEGWAVALREATEELAAEGVYLDHTGTVSGEEPAQPWGWADGTPALAQRQRLLSRRRAEASRTRLLTTLPPAARARLRSCGGPGAGAWLLAAPTSNATRFKDAEFRVCSRLRLRVPLGLGGPTDRCRNRRTGDPLEEEPPGVAGRECQKPLDADGFHALTCRVGGLVIRRHNAIRDVFAWIGRAAGYVSSTEVFEPAWTRARVDAQGEVEVEQARLDCRFAGPPSDPLVYGDVVVTHPEGSARLHAAADADGAAAAGAADDKHRRYPASLLPGGRLVPFSVETFGRWGAEARGWLRDAVDAVAERDPQVAAAGHWGKVAVLNAWFTRLSVALQKNNAACVLQAGRVRGSADLGGESGWEEDIDDLLREAAAAAGWSDFEA